MKKKYLEEDAQDLSVKLKKAQGEIQKCLMKNKEMVKKNDEITRENEMFKDDLTRCKTENENIRLVLEIKKKEMKMYENNIVRKDDKIDNLESYVKDLKGKVTWS